MRKENSDAESGQKFKENFRTLYEMSRCQSITQFAQKLRMNRQSVDRYYNGERLPDLTSIVQICRITNVSADWLLGMSDVLSVDDDMKTTIKTLGLSEKALMKIIDPNEIGRLRNELSHLIEAEDFYSFLKEYKYFLDLVGRLDTFEDSEYIENEDGKIVLSKNAGIHFFMNQLSLQLRSICDEDYFRQANIAAKNTHQKKLDHFDEILKEYEYWKTRK